ncbi:MAG: YitT family protein [Anaerotruncus sp.]|nr:YitT family protein [Anaerotruncus sp. G3(2012)]MCI9235704.1 YitT family protein [Anaerotruncus sp.]
MPEKHLQWLRTVPLILLGNAVYALAVTAFILPTGLVTGGSTGLALVFYHGAGVPVTLFVSAFNLLMFLVGLAVLGRQFALTTLLSTVSYPLILGVLERLPQLEALTSDRMLAAVYGGLMIGLGIGIVIKAGASTGGMDIPPLVLRKKLGIPVSLSMYGFDFLILLFQMRFADQEQVLYGLLMVLIYTTVLDKVLLFGQARTQVKVVSEQYEQINREIIQTLDRGSTLIHAETGYLRTCRPVVLTVVSNRELPRLNELILSIDPNAFMVINRVSEVKGRGFTLSKENRAPLLEPEEPPGGSQA